MERKLKDTTLKFFVLVPVYKVEKYIQSCIDSVLHQTYQNFELILVDDGSPDNCGKICDEYALKDKRITVIHQENRGLIAARQAAVKYVQQALSSCQVVDQDKTINRKDTFIIYLDSDDSLKEMALELIYHTIQEYNCDIVIYGAERVIDGKVVMPYDKQNGFTGIVENKRVLYNMVFNKMEYNSLCRKAVSAKILPDIEYNKYFSVLHGEDLLQSIAYYRDCKRVYFLNQSLYQYTVNPESITQTVSYKNFKVDFTVRQCVFEFLLSENVFTTEDWKQYRTYCIQLLIDIIQTISNFQVNAKQKKYYFDEIRKSEYYQKYIYRQEYRKIGLTRVGIIYKFFEKGIYWPILFACTFRQMKRKLS